MTVRGTTLATATDPQGRFQLNQVPPGEQTCVSPSQATRPRPFTDVRVLAGQQSKVDGVLRPEFYEMEERSHRRGVSGAERAIVAGPPASQRLDGCHGLGAILAVGAGDAAEIMAKVTGVTMAEGKYVVIRGLSDRYTATLLNGAEVPSADPYRRAVQFDLFPSDMIERVVVAKRLRRTTGRFRGGAANIVTKSFPEKFLLYLGAGVGYNTQTSLKNSFTSYKGGGTDWLALDDGSRKLPGNVSSIPPNQLPRPPFSAGNVGLMEEINAAFGSHQFAPTMETAPLNHDFSCSATR